MTPERIVQVTVGILLIIASPVLWKKWNLDGMIAFIVFCLGAQMVTNPGFHC